MKARIFLAAAALAIFIYGCDLGFSPGGGTGVDGLTGIVVDGRGEPVAGARVRVYPAPAALAKSAQASVAIADSTYTGGDGRYRFKQLPEGVYNLEASFRSHDTTYTLFVGGIAFDRRLDLGIDTLRASGGISLRVRNASGAPVGGALCVIAGSPWSVNADSLGTCLFTGVAPGTYRVHVTGTGVADDVDVFVQEHVVTQAQTSSGPVSAPSPPSLLSDARDGLDPAKPIVFTWSSPSTDAITHYRLQVSYDSLFAVLVFNDSVSYNPDSLGVSRRRTTTLRNDQKRYWRVWAHGPGGSAVSKARVHDEGPSMTFTRRSVTDASNDSLHAVAWTGSQFVAVGNSGRVVTSPDGVNWTARATGRAEHFYGVSSKGNLLVAVGGSNFGDNRMGDSAILTSTDGGSTWMPHYTSARRSVLRAVTWSTTRWVAIGDSGAIWMSPDGVTGWVRQASGTTHDLYAVTWSGASFYAVGHARGDSSSVLLTSSDGLSWNAIETGPAGSAWNSVATDNTRLVITGKAGEGWYLRQSVPLTRAPYRTDIRGLHFGDLIYGVGSVPFPGSGINEHATLWTSIDGAIWTKLFEDGVQGYFNAVVSNGTRVVAVGRGIVSSN